MCVCKRYEGSDDEEGVEDVGLEGEQRQAHVGEDEVLRQEVQQLKELGEEIKPPSKCQTVEIQPVFITTIKIIPLQ